MQDSLDILRTDYKSEDSIEHHGIKGMKWGVRRFQNADGSLTQEGITRYGSKNIKRAKTANLDKWGKTPETNVLYIAGYSGSGKSTTALSLSKKGDTVLHLDGYSEPDSPSSITNKKFNEYLNKKVPNWKLMKDATKTSKVKRYSKEYWDIVEKFDKAIDSYAKEEFKKGNRVIVEGVQIADSWLKADLKDYEGKPAIILGTNPVKSMKRAFNRDDRGGLLKGLGSLDSAKEYLQWYSNTNKRLKELNNAIVKR